MGAGRGRANVGKVIEKAAHLGQVEGAVDLNGIMAGHTRQHGLDNFVVGAGSPRRRQSCEGITVNFHIRIFGEDRGHGSQHDGGTSERLCLKSDTLQNAREILRTTTSLRVSAPARLETGGADAARPEREIPT